MNKNKILYQIKTLEKMIFRNFIINDECMEDNLKTFNKPTPTQMQIMEYIMDNQNKDIYQKDLEEILSLRRATVSGVLQTMEKNNLIIRVSDNEDNRIKKIILNEKTKEIFEKTNKKFEQLEKLIIKDIPKDDIESFLRVIKLMENNIKKYNKCKLNLQERK